MQLDYIYLQIADFHSITINTSNNRHPNKLVSSEKLIISVNSCYCWQSMSSVRWLKGEEVRFSSVVLTGSHLTCFTFIENQNRCFELNDCHETNYGSKKTKTYRRNYSTSEEENLCVLLRYIFFYFASYYSDYYSCCCCCCCSTIRTILVDKRERLERSDVRFVVSFLFRWFAWEKTIDGIDDRWRDFLVHQINIRLSDRLFVHRSSFIVSHIDQTRKKRF